MQNDFGNKTLKNNFQFWADLASPNLRKPLNKQWFLNIFRCSMFFIRSSIVDRFVIDLEVQNEIKFEYICLKHQCKIGVAIWWVVSSRFVLIFLIFGDATHDKQHKILKKSPWGNKNNWKSHPEKKHDWNSHPDATKWLKKSPWDKKWLKKSPWYAKMIEKVTLRRTKNWKSNPEGKQW